MNGCNHTTEQSCLRGNECAQCLRELQCDVNTLRAENEQLKAELEMHKARTEGGCVTTAKMKLSEQLNQLRADVERLKTELLAYGHRATETSIEFNDMRQERDQWRKDAEICARVANEMMLTVKAYRPEPPQPNSLMEHWIETLAAHERLIQEAKK